MQSRLQAAKGSKGGRGRVVIASESSCDTTSTSTCTKTNTCRSDTCGGDCGDTCCQTQTQSLSGTCSGDCGGTCCQTDSGTCGGDCGGTCCQTKSNSNSCSCGKPRHCKLVCGEGEIKWHNCKGNLVSRIVSTPSSRALECNLQKNLDYIAGLYNSASQITGFQIEHLGLLADNSTLVIFTIATPVPEVTVGITDSALALAAILTELKLAQPTSILTPSYVYRIQANDLLTITITLTITWTDGIGIVHTATVYITGQMHIIACGNTTPRFDTATVVVEVEPPQ